MSGRHISSIQLLMPKLILSVLIFLLACTSPCFGQANNKSREADILESVFRYQIAHCYRYRSPETYFLSYANQDPSDELMARFASSGTRVMKRSQFRHFKNPDTGKWSIILSVSYIDFQSAGRADVRGACTAASLDAYDYLYRVSLRNGRWVVVHRKLIGVS